MKRKTYLLDTDIVIYWLKGVHLRIDEKINESGLENVSISSITVAELYFGAYNSTKKEENVQTLDELIPELRTIAFDENAGRVFGEIKAELKKTGKTLSDSDLCSSRRSHCRTILHWSATTNVIFHGSTD